VLLWLKPQNLDAKMMHIFGFQQSLTCYFTPYATLACDSSDDYDRLEASTSKVTPGQWTHLTVSGNPSNGSYIQIENNQWILSQNFANYLNLKQTISNWVICLSSCDLNFGYEGGMRDFVWLNQQITPSAATRLKNSWLLSDSSVLAYFRFTETNFFYDESSLRRASVIGSQSGIVAIDYSPNDICSAFQDTEYFYKQTSAVNLVNTINLSGRWSPRTTGWSYSSNIWIRASPETCTEGNPLTAQDTCFIFKLQQAFMMFMPAPG
jgi:hypothetical protein